MLNNTNEMLAFFNNTDAFTTTVEYSADHFGFSSTLIEKDYLCSLILMYLYQDKTTRDLLIFKGGTLLSKIHSEFHRLSEDLDFTISTSPNAIPSERRNSIKPIKSIVNNIQKSLPIFEIATPLTGHNNSIQYNAELHYQSSLSSTYERILIEIGLHERTIETPIKKHAKTLLYDQFKLESKVNPFSISCLTLTETYAEKIRAALTRKIEKIAIRDFFDLDYAIQNKMIDLNDKYFIDLVSRKLEISGEICFGEHCKDILESKIPTELFPTLSLKSQKLFNLDRIINDLQAFLQDINKNQFIGE